MSRPVTVNIPHKLGKAEARRRIEEGFGNMRAQMTGGVTGLMLSFYERWKTIVFISRAGHLVRRYTGTLMCSKSQL